MPEITIDTEGINGVMPGITIDKEGINGYLSDIGQPRVRGIEVDYMGVKPTRNSFGRVILSYPTMSGEETNVETYREGTEFEPFYQTTNIFGSITYRLATKLRRLLRRPYLHEIAAGIECENNLRVATAALLAHEIGHWQKGQILPILIHFSGSMMVPFGAIALVERSSGVGVCMSILLAGLGMLLIGRVLSEYQADNFAEKHAANILPFVEVES